MNVHWRREFIAAGLSPAGHSRRIPRVLEMAELVPGSSDPHGLAMHDGALISCDAGIHPGWPNYDSPTTGWIFRIDIV